MTGVISELKIHNDSIDGDVKLGTGAYSFNGSTDKITTTVQIPQTTDHTVTWWQKVNSTLATDTTYQFIMRATGSSGNYYAIFFRDNFLKCMKGEGSQTQLIIQSNFPVDVWNHCALVRNNTTDDVTFYLNGVARTVTNGMTEVDTSANLWIGSNNGSEGTPVTIDDMSVWSRSLSSSEIETLANTTSRQGYEGGLGGGASPYSGGGGGGAGGAGANGSAGVAGAGGVGIENPITGSEVGELNGGKYWLGGGGGGFGNTSSGAGGKGGGSGNNSGDNGTANTGGGAGARDGNTGAGGSGVVLVSYQTGQITDGSSDGSLETGSNIPSGYAIRKFVLTGSSTQNFNFVISSGSGNVQYVIVGGGGGGGTDSYSSARGSGGGGGGGFVTGTKSMSAGTYSVTVGRGGADATNGSNSDGGDGDNSVL